MTKEPNAPLVIDSLEIRHFAGVRNENAFKLQNLSPGINIIYGPNGCGKSTTARAMQQLIWPASTSEYSDLHAEVHWKDQRWELLSRGKEVKALSGTESLPHPSWAPPETRGRYHWSLQNLLQEKDGELARQIAKEMAGGIDFHALAIALKWEKKPAAPNKLHQNYLAADKKLRETKALQQALKQESRTLADLKQRCEQSLLQAEQAPLLAQALEFADKTQRLNSLQESLSQFPPHLKTLNGDDADKLESLLKEQQDLQKQLENLKRQKAGLGSGEEEWATVSEQDFQKAGKELQSLLDHIQELERASREAEADFHAAETEQQTLHASIGIHARAALELAEGFKYPQLHEWIRLIFRQIALQERITLLQEALPAEDHLTLYDPDLIRTARSNLEAWLNQQSPAKASSWSGFALSMSSLAGLLLYLCLEKGFSWLWTLLLLPPPLIQLLLQNLRTTRQSLQLQHQHPSALPPPESWEPDAVTTYLKDMDQWLRESHKDRLHQIDRRRLQEAETQAATVDSEIHQLQSQLQTAGLSLEADHEWMAHFLSTVQAWRQLRVKTKVEEDKWTSVDEQKKQAEQNLRDRLNNWGHREHALQLSVVVEDLRQRMDNEIARRHQQKEVDLTLRHLQQLLNKNQQDCKELCQRIGLDSPDVTTLRQWVALLPEWNQTFRQSEAIKDRLSDLRKLMGDEEALLSTDPGELTARYQACEEAKLTERGLREQISKLEQRIDDQIKGRGVHEAEEALQQRKEALLAAREAQIDTEIGMEILDWLQEQCRSRDRSKVLQEANRNLTLFSKGTLQLQLSDEGNGNEFSAVSPGHAPKSLDRLSSGERTQLLMAVRLAFLNLNEHAPLPLLVDEALGTTDDQRGEELIRALIEVSKQGRQLFYFTAQEDEIQKWRQVLTERNEPAKLIDLSEIRGQSEHQNLSPLLPPSTPVLNFRKGKQESTKAWAQRLQIPGWHPHQPVEELSMWTFTHQQPELLHTLFEHHIHRVGQWIIFEQNNALAGLVSKNIQTEINQQIQILQIIQQYWRIGRAAKVEEAVLSQSNAVSDKFIEDVLAKLREVDGDAQALIHALDRSEVKGFRQNKIRELENEFIDQGFISSETPLSAAEVRAKTLSHFSETQINAQVFNQLMQLFFTSEPEPEQTLFTLQ
ncbi:AAA family ATPase [Kiritimatiellota bacterium B12222]|nr:AAA family ATPase [Kiritimatiellota bacterium B12222]